MKREREKVKVGEMGEKVSEGCRRAEEKQTSLY
jgi:hypothetical protein